MLLQVIDQCIKIEFIRIAWIIGAVQNHQIAALESHVHLLQIIHLLGYREREQHQSSGEGKLGHCDGCPQQSAEFALRSGTLDFCGLLPGSPTTYFCLKICYSSQGIAAARPWKGLFNGLF